MTTETTIVEDQKPQDDTATNENGSKNLFYAWGGLVVFGIVFTFLINFLGPLLDRFLLGPDLGADWYYWQLPQRNNWAMLITWSFYLSHQFITWGLIFWANRQYQDSNASKLRSYNYAMMFTIIAFSFLHLFQTHVTYDGLAQDVPIWTSQGSVIVMLVLILIMENPSRGLFLGKRAGKPLTARVAGFFRRNHGYIISWALVYTFWFHPMTYDPQLLTGFIYMFLLFTQLSLGYTEIHTKKGWIILLESFVAIHAFVVAVFNVANGSADMWPMFLMGFAFLVVFTYIYAIKVRREIRIIAALAYVAGLIWIYLPAPIGYGRELRYIMMLEFLWIPIVLYGLAYLFAGLAYGYLKLKNRE